MTLHRSEEVTVPRWLTSGWNARTVLMAIVALVGVYYMAGTRITVVEQQSAETRTKFEEVNRAITDLRHTKVDKDTYDGGQKRTSEQLNAIQQSVGRIEQILMEPKGH